jgi:hypothetical protein
MVEMTNTVSMEVGSNVSVLLRDLAVGLGTTVEKVWPWYVKQAYISGYYTLTIIGIFSVLAVIGLSVTLVGRVRGEMFTEKNGNDLSGMGILFILSCVLCVFLFVALLIDGKRVATNLLNPEYMAMQKITEHIGQLK